MFHVKHAAVRAQGNWAIRCSGSRAGARYRPASFVLRRGTPVATCPATNSGLDTIRPLLASLPQTPYVLRETWQPVDGGLRGPPGEAPLGCVYKEAA